MNTAPFFVEVLARNGEVRQRQRVDSLPIRIGRGYDNDFILDDRHTSPHHVVIERNDSGGLDVHDLGSRNGVVHKGKRCERLTIDGNTVFRLGHTSLRIRSADFSVADEQRDTTLHGWEGWPPALSGLAMMVLLSLWDTWLTDVENAEAIHYLTSLAGMLSVVLLWCGGWTLANRLFAGQTRFGRHLFIAVTGLVVVEAVSLLVSLASYSLSLDTLGRFGSMIWLVVIAGMVYFHLATINPNNTRRFAVSAVLLLALGAGLVMMFNYQNRGHLGDELYMSDLYPAGGRLRSDVSVDQFIAESQRMRAAVDAERNRVLAADGEGETE